MRQKTQSLFYQKWHKTKVIPLLRKWNGTCLYLTQLDAVKVVQSTLPYIIPPIILGGALAHMMEATVQLHMRVEPSLLILIVIMIIQIVLLLSWHLPFVEVIMHHHGENQTARVGYNIVGNVTIPVCNNIEQCSPVVVITRYPQGYISTSYSGYTNTPPERRTKQLK